MRKESKKTSVHLIMHGNICTLVAVEVEKLLLHSIVRAHHGPHHTMMATASSRRRWQLLQLVWSPILLSFLLLSVTTIPIHGYLSSRSITTTAFRQLNRRSPRLSMSSESSSKYKKVFVAGGSRGVGHAIVEKLSESGILVVALVRSEDSKIELEKIEGVTAVLGDAFDKKAIEEAMDGCDAAITTLGGTTDDRRVDYVGNNNVIESAGILGVQRIILVTSIGW